MEIVIKNKDDIQIEEIDHDFVLGFNGMDGNKIAICVQRRYLEILKEKLDTLMWYEVNKMEIKIRSESSGIFTSYNVDVFGIEGSHLEMLSKILKIIDKENKENMDNA